jgi:tRNA G18 (ribose-2'-O)-methylase SpoU
MEPEAVPPLAPFLETACSHHHPDPSSIEEEGRKRMTPNVTPIDDPDDPRVAAYRDVRERDLVGREGLFIAEGETVLRTMLAASRHPPVSLLIDAKRIAALTPLIETLPPDTPVYAAGQAVMDAITGFHIHRGILALGRRTPEPTAEALLESCGPRALVVVLFGLSNHDNMGGVFRNAAAFGADAVLLDANCCDPLYRKAIRVSVGAALVTPFARMARGTDVVGMLERHGFEALALSPSGTDLLSKLKRPARAAVLLGTEGEGLSPDVLIRTRTVRIPMASGMDSLNVATTSGLVLHHLAFAR